MHTLPRARTPGLRQKATNHDTYERDYLLALFDKVCRYSKVKTPVPGRFRQTGGMTHAIQKRKDHPKYAAQRSTVACAFPLCLWCDPGLRAVFLTPAASVSLALRTSLRRRQAKNRLNGFAAAQAGDPIGLKRQFRFRIRYLADDLFG